MNEERWNVIVYRTNDGGTAAIPTRRELLREKKRNDAKNREKSATKKKRLKQY